MNASKIKFPRLPAPQHMARNWHPEPSIISESFIRLLENPPRISYKPLFSVLYQRMLFGDDLSSLERCIDGIDTRSWFCEDLKTILRLVDSRLDSLDDYRPLEVAEDRYVIAQGHSIPFKPRLVLADQYKDRLPWFLLWKEPALNDLQLRLLNAVICDRMVERPDLEFASLEFWNVSKPDRRRNSVRQFVSVKSEDIAVLSAAELSEMLEIFVAGFEMACKEVRRRAERYSGSERYRPEENVQQRGLFDQL